MRACLTAGSLALSASVLLWACSTDTSYVAAWDSGSDGGTDSDVPGSDSGPDAGDAGSDAGTDTAVSDSGLSDAATDSGPPPSDSAVPGCDWTSAGWTFSTPVPLTALNSTANDRDPWLSPDALTLYFISSRGGGLGGWDLYSSSRVSRAASWSAPTPVTDLNTSSNDGKVSMLPNGLVAFVDTDRCCGLGAMDIWVFTRASTSDPFSAGMPLANVNSGVSDNNSEVSADGLSLYFDTTAGPATLGGTDLLVATRSTIADPFSAPVLIPGLSGSTDDTDASPSPDELRLVFTSDRAGPMGGSNIWYALRTSTALPFGMPVPVPGLASDQNDEDAVVSSDGCEVVFYSTRPGGAGPGNLWTATFVP